MKLRALLPFLLLLILSACTPTPAEHSAVPSASSAVQPAETPDSRVFSIWQADLTHDGAEETITVEGRHWCEEWAVPGWESYSVTVTGSGGVQLWYGEAAIPHAGQNGIYLYWRDGCCYLMEWLPGASTGYHTLHYRIFSLTEDGQTVPLEESTLRYGAINEDELLAVDVDAIRAFEANINALLADSAVLISTGSGDAVYSTPDSPYAPLWDSDAEEWETRQAAAQASD